MIMCIEVKGPRGTGFFIFHNHLAIRIDVRKRTTVHNQTAKSADKAGS
jgi:hypothetical protein